MTDFFASPEALPLPVTPDAVTARWLTAALRERRAEWDVQLDCGIYRLVQDPTGWWLEGVYD